MPIIEVLLCISIGINKIFPLFLYNVKKTIMLSEFCIGTIFFVAMLLFNLLVYIAHPFCAIFLSIYF